ncbi:MAG: PocR ligand-binding domain-containing protein [Victivallales bacterium]|nr:PocR ligand-binding domain-containing protein [Victivallales bacterium]
MAIKKRPEASIELILHEDVQNLLDSFAEAIGVRIVLYDSDGHIIRTDRLRDCSDYCRFIQEKLMPGMCQALDSKKQEECLRKKKLVCYRCHAGLTEAVMPVFMEGKLLGYAMIGQFRDELRLSGKILEKCPGKAAATVLSRHYLDLPYIPPGREHGILRMFKVLVEYIAERELMGLSGDWLHDKTRQFLDVRFRQDVRVADLAKFAGRSISSISHLLKERHGKTFKQMLIERRLSHAEELMKTRPELSIGEIAYQSGFVDRFYFSRLYRKYRKTTPREARRREDANT